MTRKKKLKKLLEHSPIFWVFVLGVVGGWTLVQVLFGFFLLLRYWLGAFSRTLPTGWGVFLAGFLILQTCFLACALDFIERNALRRKFRKNVQIAWFFLLASCLAGGFICLRGAPWGVFLLAGLVLAGGGYAVVRFSRNRMPEPEEESEFEEEPEELLPPQTVQSFTRAVNEAGEDTFSGLVRATFAPGLKSVTVYAAFCPPFERVPEVQCEVVDGDASVVTPIFAAPHGVRIGVKKTVAAAFEDCAILSLTAVEKKDAERKNDE